MTTGKAQENQKDFSGELSYLVELVEKRSTAATVSYLLNFINRRIDSLKEARETKQYDPSEHLGRIKELEHILNELQKLSKN